MSSEAPTGGLLEGHDCTAFCELMNGLEPDNPDLALIRERLSRMDLAACLKLKRAPP